MLYQKLLILTLFGMIQEITLGIFVLLVFSMKIDHKKVRQYAIIMGLSGSISTTFLTQSHPVLYMAIFLVMILFTLMFFYKFNFLKSLIAMFIVFFLKSIVSTLCLPIYKLFYRSDYNALNSTLLELIISQTLGTILFLLIVMTVFLFKFKIDIPNDFNKRCILTIVLNVVLSILLLYPNYIYLRTYIDTTSSSLLIYNSISLVVIVLINTFNFVKFGKIELLKQNLQFQKLYIRSLNEIIDSLRGFKHDYNNMLQVMNGYISVNDMEGLKNYHRQLLSQSKKLSNIVPLNSYIKDNPPIYGLLLSKISYCEINNVLFTITVMCKIKISSIKTYDFYKVLGILLDNAIESASDSEKKFVELSIRENRNKNSLFIEITNSCTGLVDTSSIFKNGYTTKKEHTGFGLWDVQKIAKKYNNFKLHTNAKENLFSQKIEIVYNKTSKKKINIT